MQSKLDHSTLTGQGRREDAHCHILQAAVQALRALSLPISYGVSSCEDKGCRKLSLKGYPTISTPASTRYPAPLNHREHSSLWEYLLHRTWKRASVVTLPRIHLFLSEHQEHGQRTRPAQHISRIQPLAAAAATLQSISQHKRCKDRDEVFFPPLLLWVQPSSAQRLHRARGLSRYSL